MSLTPVNFKLLLNEQEIEHHCTEIVVVDDAFGLVQRIGYLIGMGAGVLRGYNETCPVTDTIATGRPVARVILSGDFSEEDHTQVKRAMEHMLNTLKKQTDNSQVFIELDELTFKIYF